uniref:ABC transmembrane type-1 domain-containing protein n=1 Tax=Heterorhabditis bacteriophora TaxID=37862 RepID=A0A1I7XGK9_HETBA
MISYYSIREDQNRTDAFWFLNGTDPTLQIPLCMNLLSLVYHLGQCHSVGTLAVYFSLLELYYARTKVLSAIGQSRGPAAGINVDQLQKLAFNSYGSTKSISYSKEDGTPGVRLMKVYQDALCLFLKCCPKRILLIIAMILLTCINYQRLPVMCIMLSTDHTAASHKEFAQFLSVGLAKYSKVCKVVSLIMDGERSLHKYSKVSFINEYQISYICLMCQVLSCDVHLLSNAKLELGRERFPYIQRALFGKINASVRCLVYFVIKMVYCTILFYILEWLESHDAWFARISFTARI